MHDLGADAPAADQETLVDEGPEGLADGGPGEAEAGGEADLIAEEGARGSVPSSTALSSCRASWK